MTEEITLPTPKIVRIEEMAGKTIRDTLHYGDELFIVYTDGSVTCLEGGMHYDTDYITDRNGEGGVNEFILVDMGLISQEYLDAWTEQEQKKYDEAMKEHRYAQYLKLKEEFGE